MKVSHVIRNGAAFLHEDHPVVFDLVKQGVEGIGVPDEMIGDFILLLEAGRHRPIFDIPETDRQPNYYYAMMASSLVRGNRWQSLVQRFMSRRRRSNGGRKRTEEMRQRCRVVLVYLVQQLTTKLIGRQFVDPNFRGEYLANYIAYTHWKQWHNWRGNRLSSNDPSEWLVDDHLPVAAELLFRGRISSALELWLNTDLIQSCLDVRFVDEQFEPRQLEAAPREGAIRDRSAGDFSGVRSVTKKQREDQIPKVLPSEFNLVRFGGRDAGRRLVCDNIINRSPLCYQHFNPERPEIRHRVCLPFIVAAEPAQRPHKPHFLQDASIKARQLAYALLVNAAIKVPHDQIQADVVFLECRRGVWHGAEFPLSLLRKVSSSVLRKGQNVIEVDQVLRYFFVNTVLGGRRVSDQGVSTFSETPSECLSRMARSQAYRAIFPAVFMRSRESRHCVPDVPIAMPRLDRRLNSILLCCAEDHETGVRCAFFRSLMAAQLATMPLSEVALGSIVSAYLDMVVGPRVERKMIPIV